MKEPLLSLKSSELRSLARALEAGRLAPPYSAITLQRFVSNPLASNVAASLAQLAGFGCPPAAMARVIDLLATAVDQRPPIEDVVDLVTTGPDEIEGAPRATSVVVTDLFRKAEKSVIIAGYAVHQGQRVFKELADKMAQDPELHVRLYLDVQRKLGDTSSPEELVRNFSSRFRSAEWPAERPLPEVYYDVHSVELDQGKRGALHAKCVVVDERHVFVSSANFTEAAQKRNIEVGLLLDSPTLAKRVSQFFSKLVQEGLLKQLL